MANPVLPVEAADPHIALFGHIYYLYATGAGKTEPGFAVWSSPDLVRWTNEGMALRLADVDWAEGRDWAPAAAERNGTYYLYFSADDRIGIAVSDSPTGPFTDPLGEPLVAYKDDVSVIDPMAFVDEDGAAYLYWGAVPATWLEGKSARINTHLSVHRLGDDMVSLARPELHTVEVGDSGLHIEGSFVLKRGGTYYLMWSEGDWNSSEDATSYRVAYAASESPTGPWKAAADGPILATDWSVDAVGPGHHSVVQLPGEDEYYIAYHKHRGDGARRVCIDRMEFAPDGAIRTVRPSREGPGERPITLAVRAAGRGPYPAGASITLTAACRWAPSDVRAVRFYDGVTELGEVGAPPYTLEWRDPPAGFRRISARATSRAGEVAVSAPIDVDIG